MGDKTSAAAAISHMPPGYLHEYTGTKIVILAIAFMPIQIAFVSLRWYSRRLCKTYLSVDDVLSFPALFFCLAVDILAIGLCFSSPQASLEVKS